MTVPQPYPQPYPYAPPRPSSSMATIALWLSILGILTFGLTSILGVILGAVAYFETRDDQIAGKGQAISAVIVGLVVLFPMILLGLFIMSVVGAGAAAS